MHAAHRRAADRAAATATVAAALDLLDRYDPARARRLRADVAAVVVWPHAVFAGSMNPVTGICLLQHELVRDDRSGLATATVLAHEAMHARLHRRGFGYAPGERGRIERVCRRAEWHFLLRVPAFTNREAILAHARAAIEDAPTADFSDAARADALRSRLRELDWPAWLIRLVT